MSTSTPTFADFDLDPRLLAALDKLGFESPTPIQAAAMTPLLAGRDVLGQARTGSGKTAAYGLPMLHDIGEPTGRVRGLILAPTRELALQVTDALRDLAKQMPTRITTIYGGAPYPPQLKALRQGVPIVVGTPGRVLDHMERGSLDLSDLEWLVLDEADEMLRMGFIDAVETVVAACPPGRQIALLSATMPHEIQRIAEGHLIDPVVLELEDDGPHVDHIEQKWIAVHQRAKLEALDRLLRTSPPGATLVFARTRKGCAEVADALTRQGIAADALHGDLTQAARERVVHRLRAGGLGVVVATDVAARGLDVEHIGRVVNLDLPDDVETYVHRIGRTARAGREGEAISLVTSRERRRMDSFMRSLGTKIAKIHVPTDHDIAAHRAQSLVDALVETREADLQAAHAWVQDLIDDGWTLEEVAATALARVAELVDVDLSAPTDVPDDAPAPHDPGPMVELFVAAGARQGVRAGDLVGALANGIGVPSQAIGKITVLHRKSFVEMPQEIVEELLRRTKSIELRRQQVKISASFRGGRHGR